MKELQDLENSIFCRRATFGKFKFKFKILAGKIWKILDLAGKIWKVPDPAGKIWKVQILAGKIWKIQDLATHTYTS